MPNQNLTNHSAFSLECFNLDINLETTKTLLVAHILTSIINFLSSLSAVIGNAAIIFAVWKTLALQTPSNIFLCCLAFSDFTVGLLAQPAFVVHKIGEIFKIFNIYCTTRILLESLGFLTAGASVCTMTGIAIERYLALYLHLRYRQVITTKRILGVVVLIWAFYILFAASRFWIANDSIFNNIFISIILANLVLSFLAYAKVFKYVKRHENQIKEQNTGRPEFGAVNHRLLRMKRYKKSTLTMLYIIGIFIICYIPLLCVRILYRTEGYTANVKTANLYTTTIVFLNSSLNPMVYCWRISDIRSAVKEICLRQRFRWKSEVVVLKSSAEFPRRSRISSLNITRASGSVMPHFNG